MQFAIGCVNTNGAATYRSTTRVYILYPLQKNNLHYRSFLSSDYLFHARMYDDAPWWLMDTTHTPLGKKKKNIVGVLWVCYGSKQHFSVKISLIDQVEGIFNNVLFRLFPRSRHFDRPIVLLLKSSLKHASGFPLNAPTRIFSFDIIFLQAFIAR